MLKEWMNPQKPEPEELAERLGAARERLARQQMQIKEKKLPVLVLVEGWGTAGKGSIIGRIIKNIDPRFFTVAAMEEPTEEAQALPLPPFCQDSGGRKVYLLRFRMDGRGG